MSQVMRSQRYRRILRAALWGLPTAVVVAAIPTLLMWHHSPEFGWRHLVVLALMFGFGIACGMDMVAYAWWESDLETQRQADRQKSR